MVQLVTSDVNEAFDKIAELYTDPLLTVSYNTEGRAALKGAMDCIFDAGLVTLSGIYLNENVTDLAVRSYTAEVIENDVPTDRLYFEALEVSGGVECIHLSGTEGRWDCAYLQASPYMTFDRFSVSANTTPLCLNQECAGRCDFYPELDNKCECAIADSCSTVWKGGAGSSTSILTYEYP